jgi:N-methylhydantoinase A/oxoprolinase/acetone carboxylase beta subunit
LGLLERENAAILNQSLKRLAKYTVTAFKEALTTRLNISCPFYLTQNDGTMIRFVAVASLQGSIMTSQKTSLLQRFAG